MVSGKIRIKFYKVGKLKFISHLDLMRTLKGAMGRARVPLKYSEGFNPHPKMVFSLPLPVGAESQCEYLDVTLTEECDEGELMHSINRQLTKELQIMEIYTPEMSFEEITGAEYDFWFSDLSEKELVEALEGELCIEKRSKKGSVTVDLRPKIAGYAIESQGEKTRLHALLGAGSGDFVNPELLVRAIEKEVGRPVEYYSILRIELYAANGKVFR